jgi:UDP-N-acetylmuramoyl-tripeptide--D-alanyl-D-alanine ligase
MFTQEEIIRATHARIIGKGGRPISFKIHSVSQNSKKIQKGDLFVAIRGGRFDGHQFLEEAFSAGAAAALVQSGHFDPQKFSKNLLFEVHDTIEALGDLAHFYRQKFSIPSIAVTGSNGKTTTKDLIAALLGSKFRVFKTTGNLNNLIGVPFTLFELKRLSEIAVIEMGMSLPYEIKRLSEITEPTAGLITNIGQAHLQTMESKAKIAEAKGALFMSLPKDGIAFVNLDDPFLAPYVKTMRERSRERCEIVTYGMKSRDADFRGEIVENRGIGGLRIKCVWKKTTSFKEGSLEFDFSLPGEHNARNAVASVAAAIRYGADSQKFKQALESFGATEGRSQVILLTAGIYLIDDSYNANPDSMVSAIEMLGECAKGRKKVAVLGDMLELGSEEISLHKQIGQKLAQTHVDYVLTYGSLSQYIGTSARSYDHSMSVYSTLDQSDLILKLKQILKSAADCVVLIKGSHGMRMATVVEALVESIGKEE